MERAQDALHLPRAAIIDAYGNGGFRFAEMSHRGSLLCLPDSVWAWPVTSPGEIDRASLRKVIDNAAAIDFLIIGTGTRMWQPPQALRDDMRAMNISLDTMQTAHAINTYNIMIGERRKVAAALIAVP